MGRSSSRAAVGVERKTPRLIGQNAICQVCLRAKRIS